MNHEPDLAILLNGCIICVAVWYGCGQDGRIRGHRVANATEAEWAIDIAGGM